jgi:transposase-like protein
MARRIRTSEEMFPIVEAYLDRTETKKAFCARHDVPESVLTYWLKKYQRQEAPGFVEIIPPRSPESPAFMEIVYPGGARLRFFSAVEPAYLERLLRAA